MAEIHVVMVDLKSDLHSAPYQLGLLAAYARTEPEVAANVRFSFASFPQAQPVESVAETILRTEADLWAISNYAWNYRKLCRLLELVGGVERLPRIVLGGPNCAGRLGADLLRRFPALSAIVEGEGEPAFRDICSTLVDSPTADPFRGARNCRLRDETGAIVQPDLGHRVQQLDEVPSPYLTGLLPAAPSPVFYETDRGCPYRCAFCYWGNGGAKIYRMSPERVREEMTYFVTHGVSSMILADANFGIVEADLGVAELMAELNTQHGRPIKYLGVNYAKNSGDRVLEIASVLRRGGIHTATTLALQSVTPDAERTTRRYSVQPSKFVHLVSAAERQEIPTYTDLILGLPGESVDEFLVGLEAAICTGVPAIKVHQLSLLPGTELYDRQEELGLRLQSQVAQSPVPEAQRSDYWDFLVASHPKMTAEEMQHGLRLVGINHLLHNLQLGRIVDFYLARHGLAPRDAYTFFDELLLGRHAFPAEHEPLLVAVRRLILGFADAELDSYRFEGELALQVWFAGRHGRAASNAPAVRAYMHAFYGALCARYGVMLDAIDAAVLREMVDYAMLLAPKPGWQPEPAYHMVYDVQAIWADMLAAIHEVGESAPRDDDRWQQLTPRVQARLHGLLTEEYLRHRRGPVTYSVENPMPFLPGKLRVAWAVANRDWFCRVQRTA